MASAPSMFSSNFCRRLTSRRATNHGFGAAPFYTSYKLVVVNLKIPVWRVGPLQAGGAIFQIP